MKILRYGRHLSLRALYALTGIRIRRFERTARLKYLPQGWSELKTWNDDNISSSLEHHWPILLANLQGTGPLGVSHQPWYTTRDHLQNHNVMMSFGYVLGLAAHKLDSISILDWAGGIGHYYLYSKTLFPELKIDFHCHELPVFCQLGRKLLPEVHYYEDPREPLQRRYDLAICSGALHYFKDWRDQIRKLAAASTKYVYIARTYCVTSTPSFVVLNNWNLQGYSKFLSWCISREELLECAEEAGMEAIREFVYRQQELVAEGAPARIKGYGFLLRHKD